jgi:hypothetical protein
MKFLRFILSLSLSLVTLNGCKQETLTVDLSNLAKGDLPQVTQRFRYPEWQEIQPGVAFKQVSVTTNHVEELFDIVRFSPAVQEFKLAINTEHPKTISDWQQELNASIVMNGGYFDEKYKPTTEVIIDHSMFGSRLTGKTGFLHSVDGKKWQITQQAPESRANTKYSLQSYPLLIANSQANFSQGSERTAQRTVIAQDKAGNIYWIVTEYGVLSLNQLDDILLDATDLSLTAALNLDGGPSTGLVVKTPTFTYQEGTALLPVVLYLL